MEADTGTRLSGLRVDGGVSLSNELLQVQADLCDVTVERPTDVETTAAGAAIAAGLGAGLDDRAARGREAVGARPWRRVREGRAVARPRCSAVGGGWRPHHGSTVHDGG